MSLETATDDTLMERIRTSDEDALQELMRRYYARLGEFAYSLLRRRDLAEEAVSNVLISIWRRRETLTIKTGVRSYLFAAVGNQSLNLRRTEKVGDTIWLDDEMSRNLADIRRTESDILYRELHGEIDSLIRTMPPQRQLIFRMNRLEGLRYWEIAAALAIAESTVQNHMVQAVKQLAQELPRLKHSLSQSPFNGTLTPWSGT